jgi:hypothetical protein
MREHTLAIIAHRHRPIELFFWTTRYALIQWSLEEKVKAKEKNQTEESFFCIRDIYINSDDKRRSALSGL